MLRPVWTRQPQQQVPLGGSLAAGLTFLWSATSAIQEIVGRKPATTVYGTWAPSTSPVGIAYRSGTPNLQFAPPAAATSTDYTAFAYVNDDTGNGATRNPFDADDSGTARVFQLRFQSNDGIEFITFDTSGNPYFATSGALTWAPRVGMLVGRIVSNSMSVWWQGRQLATGSASGTAKTLSAALALNVGTNRSFAGAAFQSFPGQIMLAGHYNRGLSDAEIIALSQNPWLLFTPPPRRLWLPVAAASNPVLSAATVFNITPTSAQPRVDVTL